MRPVPDPGFNTWEEAMKAQPPIRPHSGPGFKPAHGGYPGAIPASGWDRHPDTSQLYGSDPATCPDCKPRRRCPFHRTH